jgi:radical SAM superfamily enzyme YgiQ (UPF0313 family)
MKILLITPPLTQPNSPYPATPFLKGFLRSNGYNTEQADLGIELLSGLFTAESLASVFSGVESSAKIKLSANAKKILNLKFQYLRTIDAVMNFLRGTDPTLTTIICTDNFLPRASRFDNVADLDWLFGTMGLTERAKHIATLYIEDLVDFIKETTNSGFELGRYQEHLSLFAPEFDKLKEVLNRPSDFVDGLMLKILQEKMDQYKPILVGFTIPFPGNLYGALKCGQYLKKSFPDVKIAWGGGYVSTELRQLSEPDVFDYADFILLDDGEAGILKLSEYLEGKTTRDALIKTFVRTDSGEVVQYGSQNNTRVPFSELPPPDYSGLPLDKYISLIELVNPMHKLWSDGRWNKLMLAHGCYWAKCAFCDTSLQYISCYDPAPAVVTADRIENIIRQTGSSGFHFVDEAAPPKLLGELSDEILKRRLTISWWTNIRFEKAFTAQLCQKMEKAGCIAVAGGIEVANDRLLKLMNKGVTIESAVKSAFNLTQNNIMVHAYLMYGFPGQTAAETVDGLEIVRQMFQEGILQSAFWHRYAMTIHSPSGIYPETFGVQHIPVKKGSFANNEIPFADKVVANLDLLGSGLRKAVYNFMHGVGLENSIESWFDRDMPKTKIPPGYVRKLIRGV